MGASEPQLAPLPSDQRTASKFVTNKLPEGQANINQPNVPSELRDAEKVQSKKNKDKILH